MTNWSQNFQQGIVQTCCCHSMVCSLWIQADSMPLSSGQPCTFLQRRTWKQMDTLTWELAQPLGGRCNSGDSVAAGSFGPALRCMNVKIHTLLFAMKWLCPDCSDVTLPALSSTLCACSQLRHCTSAMPEFSYCMNQWTYINKAHNSVPSFIACYKQTLCKCSCSFLPQTLAVFIYPYFITK